MSLSLDSSSICNVFLVVPLIVLPRIQSSTRPPFGQLAFLFLSVYAWWCCCWHTRGQGLSCHWSFASLSPRKSGCLLMRWDTKFGLPYWGSLEDQGKSCEIWREEMPEGDGCKGRAQLVWNIRDSSSWHPMLIWCFFSMMNRDFPPQDCQETTGYSRENCSSVSQLQWLPQVDEQKKTFPLFLPIRQWMPRVSPGNPGPCFHQPSAFVQGVHSDQPREDLHHRGSREQVHHQST